MEPSLAGNHRPLSSNLGETVPISADLPPDIPTHKVAIRPAFPEHDPIKAVPEDYFPNRESLGTYVGQLGEGLQSLVQLKAHWTTAWRAL
jgi:hypothetical protein